MTKDDEALREAEIQREYVAYCRKVETPTTPENFRRLYDNMTMGGGGRMEDAVISQKYLCPFDIMDDAGAFDRDYRATIKRFQAARRSTAAQLGERYGELTNGSRDASTGIPFDELYIKLVRRISGDRFNTLLMLTRPLAEDLSAGKIEAFRNVLCPQAHYARDAIQALETALVTIEREFDRASSMNA